MMAPLVLVVEDHQLLRETLVRLLQLEGIDTLAVDSGDQALALLRENSPNLVLLDMELPGAMSGMDVLYAIRNTPDLSSTLVVLHTAEPCAANLPEAQAADLVVLKPADSDQLLTLIHRLLSVTN
jgi:CheY-like chemotaxis protein